MKEITVDGVTYVFVREPSIYSAPSCFVFGKGYKEHNETIRRKIAACLVRAGRLIRKEDYKETESAVYKKGELFYGI